MGSQHTRMMTDIMSDDEHGDEDAAADFINFPANFTNGLSLPPSARKRTSVQDKFNVHKAAVGEQIQQQQMFQFHKSDLIYLDYKVHRQSLELKSMIMISKAIHSLIGVKRLGTTLHIHSLKA